jgi:hypothetical protein
MPLRRPHRAAVSALAALALLAAPARASADVAVDWFDQTRDTVTAAAVSAQAVNSRTWAVSWIAAARAVRHRHGAAADAALSTAVHDALVAQVPAREPELDAALASTLAGIADGWPKRAGVRAGQRAAAKTLAWREGDGLDLASVNIPFTPPTPGPGDWELTPPFGAVVQAGLPDARPVLLGKADRFRAPAPPALGSETYAADLSESKRFGGATSAVRTPGETDLAKFWSQTSLGAYTGVLRAVLTGAPHRSTAWKAGLVASFHAITLDTQIAIYESKYHYLRWRPITAIQTEDPSWVPLITTPQHPEYPSGHAGYAGAAAEILRALVGRRPPEPFSLTSPNARGVTLDYGDDAWSKLVEQNVDARVWSGIHFRTSDEIAANVGRRVAWYDLQRLHRLIR